MLAPTPTDVEFFSMSFSYSTRCSSMENPFFIRLAHPLIPSKNEANGNEQRQFDVLNAAHAGGSTGFSFTLLAGVIKSQNRKWWTTAYGGRDE